MGDLARLPQCQIGLLFFSAFLRVQGWYGGGKIPGHEICVGVAVVAEKMGDLARLSQCQIGSLFFSPLLQST